MKPKAMFRDDLYKVKEKKAPDDGSFVTEVVLDSSHKIFAGHFPGNPVLPGVCMMQMVKEQLEEHLGTALQFTSADNIKFLAVINPVQTPAVTITVKYRKDENGNYVSDSTLSAGSTFYFKLAKAVYKPAL